MRARVAASWPDCSGIVPETLGQILSICQRLEAGARNTYEESAPLRVARYTPAVSPRWLASSALALAALGLMPPASAAPLPVRGRVIVLTLDGTTLADRRRVDLPNLRAIL